MTLAAPLWAVLFWVVEILATLPETSPSKWDYPTLPNPPHHRQIRDFPALHGVVFKISAFAGYQHGYRPSGYQIQKGVFAAQLTAQPIMRNSKKYRFRCVPHCVPVECVP